MHVNHIINRCFNWCSRPAAILVISCPWHQLAWQIFIGFSLSLQADVAVVLQTGCDHFLPCPLQFIVHQPVIAWWWIPILTEVNGYGVQCTLILAAWWVGSFDCRQYTTVVETEVCAMYRWSCAVGTYSFHINSKVDWDCLQPFVTKAD